MSIFEFHSRGMKELLAEKRASFSKADPRDPVVAKWFNAMGDDGDVYIDDETALRISTVYACVKVISETLAAVPVYVYQDTPDGAERVKSPLAQLLLRRPNKWQTPFEFKQMMAAHAILRGAGYARKVIDQRTGLISELIPMDPCRTQPFRAPDGTRAFVYSPASGPRQIFLQDEIFYICNATDDDGITPISVIEKARQTMGLAYSMQKFGTAFFKNGAQPSGAFKMPVGQTLGNEAYERLKRDLERRHTGIENAGKPFVLEEGLEYQQISMSAQDAQFIESRKQSPVEICQFFRMQPHKVGLLDKATFSNIEQQAIEFVTDTMMPWFKRFEEAADRDLMQPQDIDTQYIKFDDRALLRGDMQSRFQSYQIGIQQGFLNRNEVRAFEGWNKFDGGDTYLQPLNMTDAATASSKTDKTA